MVAECKDPEKVETSRGDRSLSEAACPHRLHNPKGLMRPVTRPPSTFLDMPERDSEIRHRRAHAAPSSPVSGAVVDGAAHVVLCFSACPCNVALGVKQDARMYTRKLSYEP